MKLLELFCGTKSISKEVGEYHTLDFDKQLKDRR